MIGTGGKTLCLCDGHSDGCVCGLGTGPASSLLFIPTGQMGLSLRPQAKWI